MLLLAFALQITTAGAQSVKLTFKQLTNEVYYYGIAEGMKAPNDVRRININMSGKTIIPAELQKFPNLQMLVLSGNTRKIDWAKASPEILKLKNLEYIYFQDSTLKAIPAQIFTFTKLKGLAVLNSSVAVIPAEISKLVNLEYLLLINNKISTLPVQLTTLKNLKVLYLDGNNISVFPAQMVNLKKIEELGIAENPVKNEEVKKLRKYYPKAKIVETYDMPVVEEPKQ